MADGFPDPIGQIVSLFMGCILYGVNLITLVQCLHSLLWSDAANSFKRKINWPMLTVTLLMGLVATLDVAFALRHNLYAFVYYTGPGGAAAAFANIAYWVNVMKAVDYIIQTIIGDGMLVYRCYVVYDRKWYYAAPSFLLWLAETTCGALVMAIYATFNTKTFLDASQAPRYVYSALSITVALNVLTTSLIVYRIWTVDRQTAHMRVHAYKVSRLKYITHILIESAAMYTISVIIFFCAYVANGGANYGASYNVVQIIGISFNLIIIRVHSGRAYEGTTERGSSLATVADSTPMRLPLSTFHPRSDGSPASADELPRENSIRHELVHDAKGELELHERLPVTWSTTVL